MKQRYLELDAIRGIAALMVVFFHYTVRYGQIYGYSVKPFFTFELGKYGVQLFFIVSGFVIFLTLDKTTYAVDFIVSRFSRLYPTYWAAVILTFCVVHLFHLTGREVSFCHALINLTMFQRWFNVSNVDGVYWTLAVELSFYLIMYVLFITKQIKRIDIVIVFWLFLIFLTHFLEVNKAVHIPIIVKSLLLLDYGNLFIAGIIFYKIKHKTNIFNCLILLISLLAEFYLHGKLVWLVAGYFFVFYLFSRGRLNFLSIKPLIYLGNISYSLYLIHQNIGYVVIRNLDAHDLMNSVSVVIVPLAVSIVIAGLMQAYIEQPALKLIRSKWAQCFIRDSLLEKALN